jgi:hypothetical protein
MQLKIIATTLLIPLCLGVPAIAQNTTPVRTNAQTPSAQPTASQVLAACVQNRAQTLPIPWTDVSPNHWAFKAVMTMHYCGAFRQATPPALIEKLTTQENQRLPQTQPQP